MRLTEYYLINKPKDVKVILGRIIPNSDRYFQDARTPVKSHLRKFTAFPNQVKINFKIK